MSAAPGTVWLVGAGPGDPDLLTVAAVRALRSADVVVADRLGAGPVLAALADLGAAPACKVIDVGKLPGRHPVPQQEINELLVHHARFGCTVVRLKGGDPYLFGRGGEELEHCRNAGLDVRVIPGITSAMAVPALAGIPVTHRGVATGVSVLTGHEQIAEVPGNRDHTVVLLMGVGTLAHSAAVLAAGPRGPGCPVAIIEDGYGPRQRVTIGTLASIAGQAALRRVRPPAVIVVGDVVRLSPYAPPEPAWEALGSGSAGPEPSSADG